VSHPADRSSPIEPVDWTLLDFDPLNPRLVDQTSQPQALGQDDAAERLMDDHDPISIGRSMSKFGFFPSDPLIAYADAGRYVVVEGNRRLLALRLLLDDNLRVTLGSDAWDELAAGLAPEIRNSLARPPVQVVLDRDEAAPVIGFRHIVGIKKWDAYEKAAFVRGLVASQARTGADDDEVFERVSLLTGEQPSRVRTYIRDYTLLRQAEAAGLDVADARSEFGVFTRALSSRGVRSYINAAAPADVTVDMDRAYDAPNERMADLLGWMHGENPVFTDARRLSDLGKVLESEEATEHLKATRNLDEAEAMSGAVRDRVLKNGQKALAALRLVAADLDRVEQDGPVRSVLAQIADLAASMSGGGLPPFAADPAGDVPAADEGYDLTTEDDDVAQDGGRPDGEGG
jgi:hypothetical protein